MYKKIFNSKWPFFFIFLLWGIFASPYFVKGLIPFPSTYLVNSFAPWSAYQQFWGPVKNGAMPDVITQIYPWKHFTIETLKKGSLPLWNPYNFSGNPHLANFQSAVLSPFNILFFILPFVDAWSIMILLQPLLAGLFMYLFVREIGVSRVGSVVSSITFMFCGFIVVWMAYGTLAYAILYLPLVLYIFEKYYTTNRKRFLILMAITIPLSFFSGHFQMSFYFFFVMVFYSIFLYLKDKDLRKILLVFVSIIFGTFLSLPQLIPSIQLYQVSVRSEIFTLSEAIPFSYLITAVAPDFFGNPVTRNDWFGHYAEWASFVGIWPLLLAFFATIQRKNKSIIFFAILALFSILLSVDGPLARLIVSLQIPVISTSAVSRIIVLFSFAVAVLAGFGMDAVIEYLLERKQKKLFVIILIGFLLFAGIWMLLLIGRPLSLEKLIVAKRNFIFPTFLLLIGTVLMFLLAKIRLFIRIIPIVIILLISFDSFRFAQKWMPFDKRQYMYPDVPIIREIQSRIGYSRLFGNIGTEVASYYGIQTIEGYDPLYIGRYGELLRASSNGTFEKAERSVAKLPRRGKYVDRVLDILGVSLIFHPIADTNQGWAFPVWDNPDKYEVIYKDNLFQLFKNREALPRAALFYDYTVIGKPEEIIKTIFSDTFPYKTTLVLEESIKEKIVRGGSGSAQIVSYLATKVIIDITTSKPALLFLSDTHYPYWKAFVNGKETKIFRADYAFRAVAVPEGKSQVVFTYCDLQLCL